MVNGGISDLVHFLVSQVWNHQLALEEMNVIVFIELELIISMSNIALAGTTY